MRPASGTSGGIENPATVAEAPSTGSHPRAGKSERRDKKARRKKLNAVHELCRQFGESELDTALQMLQLFHAEVVRASHAETEKDEAAASAGMVSAVSTN